MAMPRASIMSATDVSRALLIPATHRVHGNGNWNYQEASRPRSSKARSRSQRDRARAEDRSVRLFLEVAVGSIDTELAQRRSDVDTAQHGVRLQQRVDAGTSRGSSRPRTRAAAARRPAP